MASIYRRGKVYWISYSTPAGQVQRSLKTRDRDVAKLEKKRVEYQLSLGAVAAVSHRFAEYATVYVNWRATEFPDSQQRVAQIFRDYLTPFFGEYELEQVDAALGRRYVTKRRLEGASVGTITKELRSLKALFARAVEDGLLPRNPLSKVKPPKDVNDTPPGAYSAAQLEGLYAASPFHADQWRFLANTGLRRGDALNLRIEHCTGDQALIISRPRARTKSGKTRIVPLNAAAQAARDALAAVSTSEYLFARVYPQSLSRAFDRCAARAGLPGSIHWLRHTFITRLMHAHVDVRTVQELAGHSTVVLTMRYTHPLPEHLRGAVEKL